MMNKTKKMHNQVMKDLKEFMKKRKISEKECKPMFNNSNKKKA